MMQTLQHLQPCGFQYTWGISTHAVAFFVNLKCYSTDTEQVTRRTMMHKKEMLTYIFNVMQLFGLWMIKTIWVDSFLVHTCIL